MKVIMKKKKIYIQLDKNTLNGDAFSNLTENMFRIKTSTKNK